MNMSNRSRNGNLSLNHACGRRLSSYATTMLGGARRPRQPSPLLLACRLLTQCLHIARRMAKQDPHLFGPKARDYYLETLALERREQEMEAAIRKVYGPPPHGQPPPVSTLWADRYFPPPGQRRMFLKWFREHYP
jgi:hypothetical protein